MAGSADGTVAERRQARARFAPVASRYGGEPSARSCTRPCARTGRPSSRGGESSAGASLPGSWWASSSATRLRHPRARVCASALRRVRRRTAVALSCKGRGFCPSCTTRPDALTPRPTCGSGDPHVPCASGSSRCRAGRASFSPEIRDSSHHARHRAARDLGPPAPTRPTGRSARAARASDHIVQRFGGALNLNVHFHCVIPDGVFVPGERQRALC